MEYRRFGTSDLMSSAIGFGCWEMSGVYGAFDQSDIARAVNRAIDLGVTLFDTAPTYGFGQSEEILSRALGARRNDIVLVSKTAISWDPRTKTRKYDSRYTTVKSIVEGSLGRLRTDHLDLLLIHWPDADTPLAETMEALNDLIAEGKTRYVGVSNYTAFEIEESRKLAPICANQVGYNLFDRRWERQMFATAREVGVGIMAYGPMAHGLLTGTMGPGHRWDADDWRGRGLIFGQDLFGSETLPRNLEVVGRLKRVADRLETSLPRLALAWVLRHPALTVALSGCRAPAEIEENVQALDVKLGADVLAEIDAIMRGAAGLVEHLPSRHHEPNRVPALSAGATPRSSPAAVVRGGPC